MLLGGAGELLYRGATLSQTNAYSGGGYGTAVGLIAAGALATQVTVSPSRVLLVDVGVGGGALIEIAKLLLDALGGRAVGERVHEALDLPDDAIMLGAERGKTRPGAGLQAIPFRGELQREDFEQGRVHQPMAKPVHDGGFQHIATDRQPVGAPASHAVYMSRPDEVARLIEKAAKASAP